MTEPQVEKEITTPDTDPISLEDAQNLGLVPPSQPSQTPEDEEAKAKAAADLQAQIDHATQVLGQVPQLVYLNVRKMMRDLATVKTKFNESMQGVDSIFGAAQFLGMAESCKQLQEFNFSFHVKNIQESLVTAEVYLRSIEGLLDYADFSVPAQEDTSPTPEEPKV